MTWTAPEWTLLVVPPVLLTAQSTLCQFPQTPSLRLFRLALVLPCILAVLRYCDTFFTPKKDFVIFNIVIQITKAWAVARSIELGTASTQYRWIGYEAAYHGSKDTQPKAQPTSPVRATFDGWSNLCSLRGTGWSWGIKGDQIPAPHKSVGSLLFILAWSQLLTVASVALVITIRRNGGPELYLSHLLSRPPSTTIDVAARALHVLCVGTAIYTALEMGFAALTLAVMVSTALLRAVLPSSLAPRPFDLRAWPRLMSWSGPGATSLHSFWGSRWHALFRRLFLHVGAKPTTTALATLGAGKALQSAAGAFGAFAVSGLMHESYNEATSYIPRDPHYDTFKFFILQPVGIILESVWSRSTGKKVGGWLGILWTFAFLLATGNLMVDCWIKRGAVDFAPPLSQWEWWRWTVPFGFVFPAAC